jgi:hypothetical protein
VPSSAFDISFNATNACPLLVVALPVVSGFRRVRLSTDTNRPMCSLRGSAHSSRSSEEKLFGIDFSYLHVSKQHSIEPRCDQLDSQLFEAEYLADKDSLLVPADVAAIVDSSQLKSLRVREFRQLVRQSYRAPDVKTCGNLVVQALMRALIVERVTEVIEAALLCSKGCRRWCGRVLLQRAMHPLVAAVLLCRPA